MSNSYCECKKSCTLLAVAASVIVGIITFVLRFTATITVTPAFLWALLGTAVVYLLVSPVTVYFARSAGTQGCLCPAVNALIWGILGTIITAIVLLGIEFVATSIVGAIITGVLLAFFTLTVTSVACIVKCISGCDGITY